jgi:cell division protein FtsI/penicillin-binding protein 2
MFLNKDINNHKQNFLNYFVGFFPVKLPIVMVVVMLDQIQLSDCYQCQGCIFSHILEREEVPFH